MRYEVLMYGVPPGLNSIIIDAPDQWAAVLQAGILVGKAVKRRKGHFDQSKSGVRSVLLTSKPLKNQHTEPR